MAHEQASDRFVVAIGYSVAFDSGWIGPKAVYGTTEEDNNPTFSYQFTVVYEERLRCKFDQSLEYYEQSYWKTVGSNRALDVTDPEEGDDALPIVENHPVVLTCTRKQDGSLRAYIPFCLHILRDNKWHRYRPTLKFDVTMNNLAPAPNVPVSLQRTTELFKKTYKQTLEPMLECRKMLAHKIGRQIGTFDVVRKQSENNGTVESEAAYAAILAAQFHCLRGDENPAGVVDLNSHTYNHHNCLLYTSDAADE